MRRVVAMISAALLFAACHTVFDGDLGLIGCEDDGAYGPPACPAGNTCVAGSCSAVGAPIGASCSVDQDCGDGFCFDPGDIGQTGSKRCSQPCCTSTDCGDPRFGQICLPPPDGAGSLCWPASSAGRGALGLGRDGDPCTDDGACRSGLCLGGACVDVCCTDANCFDGEICRVALIDELAPQEAWTCGLSGAVATGYGCDGSEDCPTSKCLVVEGEVMACAEPCCSSDACGQIDVMGTIRPLACTWVAGDLRSCGRLLPPTATAGVGAPCVFPDECRSGQCLDGYCTDLCCNDASCGDPSVFSCLPRPLGDSWVLRCVRK